MSPKSFCAWKGAPASGACGAPPTRLQRRGGADRRSLSDCTVDGEEQVDEEGGDMEQGRYGLDGLRKTRCLHNLAWVLLRACAYSVVWTMACECCRCYRAHCCISVAARAHIKLRVRLGKVWEWRTELVACEKTRTTGWSDSTCITFLRHLRQTFYFLQPT